MAEYESIRTGRHCVFVLHAHLVFVTKYRHRVFTDTHLQRMEEQMHVVAELGQTAGEIADDRFGAAAGGRCTGTQGDTISPIFMTGPRPRWPQQWCGCGQFANMRRNHGSGTGYPDGRRRYRWSSIRNRDKRAVDRKYYRNLVSLNMPSSEITVYGAFGAAATSPLLSDFGASIPGTSIRTPIFAVGSFARTWV
jgi:hypothetical protein